MALKNEKLRTTMVSGRQRGLPVKRGLLSDSANATDPVLVDHLVIIPQLLCLWIVEFTEGDF